MEIRIKRIEELTLYERIALQSLTLVHGEMQHLLFGTDGIAYIATEDSKYVGLAILRDPEDRLQEFDVFVRKEFRRKGLGRALVQQARKDAKMDINVEPSDVSGRKFYEAVGLIDNEEDSLCTENG